MKLRGYKLYFKDGLHLDAGGFGMESTTTLISSDTLFSAVCCTAQMLFGDAKVEELLNTEGAISSAFPFKGDILYFPRPLLTFNNFNFVDSYSDEKAFRKMRYFPLTLFEKMLCKTRSEVDLDFEVKNNVQRLKPVKLDFMQERERPRIAVDRITQSTTIFHFDELLFDNAQDNGLYFFVDDTLNKDIFLPALRLLGDEGIGADSTIGKGLFEVEEFEIDINLPKNPNAYVLLSLYNPTTNELQSLNTEGSYYDIVTRRGWLSSNTWAERRKSVRMFREGSVLQFNESLTTLEGRNLPVVDSNNAIKRWGKAFALPIELP